MSDMKLLNRCIVLKKSQTEPRLASMTSVHGVAEYVNISPFKAPLKKFTTDFISEIVPLFPETAINVDILRIQQ